MMMMMMMMVVVVVVVMMMMMMTTMVKMILMVVTQGILPILKPKTMLQVLAAGDVSGPVCAPSSTSCHRSVYILSLCIAKLSLQCPAADDDCAVAAAAAAAAATNSVRVSRCCRVRCFRS